MQKKKKKKKKINFTYSTDYKLVKVWLISLIELTGRLTNSNWELIKDQVS